MRNSAITFARWYCDRACLFVGWFIVCSWCSLWSLKNWTSNFHEIWHSYSSSVPNFTLNFSEVKVKVQG